MIKRILTSIVLIAAIIFTINTKAKDVHSTGQITFVQCILEDGKVQSCTDITDGKILDTSKVVIK